MTIAQDVSQSEPRSTWSIEGVASGFMEEDNSDILTSRKIQQEVLDILDEPA